MRQLIVPPGNLYNIKHYEQHKIMKSKVIYKVSEIISDDWNAKNCWLCLAVGGNTYFEKYEDAKRYRDENEDEFTKFALDKIFVTQYE